MTDEHNTENKQRLADYRRELAVWADAYSEKEISFEHLGGRKLQGPFVPEKSNENISFEHIGGKRID